MLFTIDNLQIHCDVLGDGEPILFIHGFPLSNELWRAAAQGLSERWRCILPDLRGHGRSAATPEVSMAHYADDLAALLDKLREWRPAVIIGMSMGGYIAFEFFRRHRNRVRALVLCDTQANADTPEAVARREALAQAVMNDGSIVAADAMVPRLFAAGASVELRQKWQSIISNSPPVGVAAAARALARRPDSNPTLAEIDCPTLVVVGQEDTLTPPSLAEELRRAIRGSRLEIIPAAGHMSPVEQPASFNSVLRTFLDSLQ